MKKQDALEHIRKTVGYVPYIMFFEMYSDDDNIDQSFIDHVIRLGSPSKTGTVLYGSAKYFKALEKAMK